jgi:hypothetical protein
MDMRTHAHPVVQLLQKDCFVETDGNSERGKNLQRRFFDQQFATS